MDSFLAEDNIETIWNNQFQALGYSRLPESAIGSDGSASEPASYSGLILKDRPEMAAARLSPHIQRSRAEDYHRADHVFMNSSLAGDIVNDGNNSGPQCWPSANGSRNLYGATGPQNTRAFVIHEGQFKWLNN